MVAGAINPTSPVQINRIADQDLTGIREDPGESDIPLPLQRKINEHKPRTRASRRVYKAEGMATRGVASRPPKQLHQEPTPAGRPVLGGPSHLELQFYETKNIDQAQDTSTQVQDTSTLFLDKNTQVQDTSIVIRGDGNYSIYRFNRAENKLIQS